MQRILKVFVFPVAALVAWGLGCSVVYLDRLQAFWPSSTSNLPNLYLVCPQKPNLEPTEPPKTQTEPQTEPGLTQH